MILQDTSRFIVSYKFPGGSFLRKFYETFIAKNYLRLVHMFTINYKIDPRDRKSWEII